MTDFLTRFAAPGPADPPSLQMLLADLGELTADGLRAAVREYHPDLADAAVDLVPGSEMPADAGPPPTLVGLVAWAGHRVKLLGFDGPMPGDAVEACLRPALLPPDMKADARAHRAHLILYYAGDAADPLEQLVAVAAVAGAAAHFAAVVTLNEEARSAVPAFALLPDEPGEDMLATLRTLPVPYLYGGFVRMTVSDTPGVWMRTYACPRLGLPNLALHAPGHDAGERVFHLFAGVLGYLRETGVSLEPGERLAIDDTTTLRVREPGAVEWWLDSRGPLWVLEACDPPSS